MKWRRWFWGCDELDIYTNMPLRRIERSALDCPSQQQHWKAGHSEAGQQYSMLDNPLTVVRSVAKHNGIVKEADSEAPMHNSLFPSLSSIADNPTDSMA